MGWGKGLNLSQRSIFGIIMLMKSDHEPGGPTVKPA